MPFLNTEIPELSGFDTGLCLSNLDVLGVRQHRVSESVLAVLSELTDALIRDAEGDPDTVDSILLSLQSPPDMEEDDDPAVSRILASVAPVNRDAVRRMSARSGLYARLLLYRMIEESQHREEIINAGFDSEVVEKIHAMIMRNEKKRYQFPPVLRLSTCAFGHERLMPLTNKYGD